MWKLAASMVLIDPPSPIIDPRQNENAGNSGNKNQG
jgi:hypothetical protein